MKALIHKFTPIEKHAVNVEIRKQIAENMENMNADLTAIVLWQLHSQLGFGKERLLRFYERFAPALRELVDYYEMPQNDQGFICKQRLKELGIDTDMLHETFCLETKIVK